MVDVQWAMSQLDKVYAVEDQFRFALATEFLQTYGEDRVTVERKAIDGNRTDICVRKEDFTVPIELKYPTAGGEVRDERSGETYRVAENHDSSRAHYDLIKDIKRVERVVSDQGGYGFVVLLTNVPNFWSKPNQEALHDDFRVYEERTIAGELSWREHRSWMEEGGRDEPIELDGEYEIQWEEFTYRDGIQFTGSVPFRYLIIRVTCPSG